MAATPDISGADYLKVLICSANVGNAEPTPASFAAWVPNDGEINEPLSNTQYPVGPEEINLTVGPYATATDNNHEAMMQSLKQNKSTNKFDIIVLGMQEAAFVNKQKKEVLDNSHRTEDGLDDTTTSRHSSDTNDKSSPGKMGKNHKRFNPLNMGAKQAAKAGMAVRGISANQTYKRKNNGDSQTNIMNSNRNVDVLSYDTNKLKDLIKTRCPSYEMVTSSLRGEMRLFILAHTSVAEDITEVYVAAENTGIGSIMANKGGIIVTLTLRDLTRFSFMTCHLEAHEGMNHYNNRNKNLAEILGGAKTDPEYRLQDATVISHHMFLCGDLNYRIKFSEYDDAKGKKKKGIAKKLMKKISGRGVLSLGASSSEVVEDDAVIAKNNRDGGVVGGPTIEEDLEADVAPMAAGEKKDEPANGSHFDQAKAYVEAKDWKSLNGGDELAAALKQKECLIGFSTLPCHWPPTFKVARGEGYQYNEKRTPSYTDRILWKSAEGVRDNVIPILYEPCPEFITSDHKPIRGGFAVKLNKCKPMSTTSATQSMITHDGRGVFDEQIQILVSGLKCKDLPIMDNEVIGGLSDPYVKFVSSPKELLYSKGWPSSTIISKSLNPAWNEDFHLTMNRKAMKNGLPEGAMFILTVVDFDATSSNDVIGSVALDLNELCSELDFSGKKSSKVQETSISRPILRNGQEYGTLECQIKTAFLASRDLKPFLSGAKNVKTATKASWKSKIQAFTGFSFGQMKLN